MHIPIKLAIFNCFCMAFIRLLETYELAELFKSFFVPTSIIFADGQWVFTSGTHFSFTFLNESSSIIEKHIKQTLASCKTIGLSSSISKFQNHLLVFYHLKFFIKNKKIVPAVSHK